MDPFVIVFAAIFLAAWLIAAGHDRKAKRKIESDGSNSQGRSPTQQGKKTNQIEQQR